VGAVDSGFTLLFEVLVMAIGQAMPVAVVARMVEEWDTRLWRVIHHYVEVARDHTDHAAVTNLALDETAARRGHNYVSLFVDLVRRRVLFVAEGRDADTVETFVKDLIAHGRNPQAIAEVCIDMSPAFIAGIASLPNAQITFDKFHVINLINEAVDAVRRAEQKSRTELKKSRYSGSRIRRTCRRASAPSWTTSPLPTSRLDAPIASASPSRRLYPAREKRRSVPQKMVLVGHSQAPATDDRSGAHGQTPLERHSPLVPQPHRQ
jgi:transposase